MLIKKISILKTIPTIDYKAAKSDRALLLKWMKSLHEYGFAKITGGGKESGEIIKIADLIGYIRETNYGKFFDVKLEVNAVNLKIWRITIKLIVHFLKLLMNVQCLLILN